MWTLYDPLTKPAQAETLKSAMISPAACPSEGEKCPSTFERLWFLLEPANPLTSRGKSKEKNN